MPRYASKYSKQEESTIRFNILEALDELGKFNGVTINTIKSTNPYALILNGITAQKVAVELNRLIDSGMVVKEINKGKAVRYMLRENYIKLIEQGKEVEVKGYGYGDYRDNKEENEEEEVELICTRILANPSSLLEAPMW